MRIKNLHLASHKTIMPSTKTTKKTVQVIAAQFFSRQPIAHYSWGEVQHTDGTSNLLGPYPTPCSWGIVVPRGTLQPFPRTLSAPSRVDA